MKQRFSPKENLYLNKFYQIMQYSRASQPISERIKLQSSNIRKIRTQGQQQTINPHLFSKSKASRPYLDVYDMIKQEKSERQHKNQKRRSRCTSFQPLLKTEQMKIFREISCLINDINQIQKQIQSQQKSKDLINQKIIHYTRGKNSHDELRLHMRERVFNQKKDLPLNFGITKTQFNQMEEQIKKISKNLEILELKNTRNLPSILQSQQNKLHALSSVYEPVTSKDGLTSMGKIQNLQHQLKSLALICKEYPQKLSQIEYLESQSQKLKQKLLSYSAKSLRDNQGSQQQAQRQRLQGYLQQQASNKIIFMQQLTELQNQFQQLKKQNTLLKKQLNIRN